jgi:hypothetical protein
MQYLRVVLLQDLAVLQPGKFYSPLPFLSFLLFTASPQLLTSILDFPILPLFDDEIFQHPDWAQFAQSVRLAHLRESEPTNKTGVESFDAAVHYTRNLIQQVDHSLSSKQELVLKWQRDMEADVRALLSGQAPQYKYVTPARVIPPVTSYAVPMTAQEQVGLILLFEHELTYLIYL